MRALSLATLLTVVALPLGATRGQAWYCYSLLPTWEYCGSCPGYQFCACSYSGHPCVNEIICNKRQNVTLGFILYTTNRTFCYLVRGCASQYGGLCDPVWNPCVKDDALGTVGAFDVYVYTGTCL